MGERGLYNGSNMISILRTFVNREGFSVCQGRPGEDRRSGTSQPERETLGSMPWD